MDNVIRRAYMLTPDDIIDLLGLTPLTPEGGYYRETYRSRESLPGSALPSRYGGRRDVCAAIYYLLSPDTFSAMHRLATDEVDGPDAMFNPERSLDR